MEPKSRGCWNRQGRRFRRRLLGLDRSRRPRSYRCWWRRWELPEGSSRSRDSSCTPIALADLANLQSCIYVDQSYKLPHFWILHKRIWICDNKKFKWIYFSGGDKKYFICDLQIVEPFGQLYFMSHIEFKVYTSIITAVIFVSDLVIFSFWSL